MARIEFFSSAPWIDGEGMLRCIRREGTPAKVHGIELYQDWEVQEEILQRFDLISDLDPADPYFSPKRMIALQRFLGYDYVTWGIDGIVWPFQTLQADDTAPLTRAGGRKFTDEHAGPIMTWEDLERFAWPKVSDGDTRHLEWLNRNLPDDMVLIGGLGGHYFENLSFLMGYETLCYALVDDPKLVRAIADQIETFFRDWYCLLVSFDRVKMVWGSDDLGFRTGTLISPADLRTYVLPGHREAARIAHDAGKLYLLHCCGQVEDILPDLIDEVGIDAKHSYEDVILPVTEMKARYGSRIAVFGGIDMDFLCRANPDQVRERVRQTLEICQPGGGYCLGTGNTVANYVPIENYLAMLDEGRRWN